MLKKCTILSLILLLAGGVIMGWLHREKQKDFQQTQSLADTHAPGSQEYIEKYGRWYRLSVEQQSQLILELEQERKSKTADELSREQQARLQADLDKLVARQIYPGEIADFLYGSGWQDQVEQYKEHQEQMAKVRTVAIVCLSIGGILFGGTAILGILWLVVRTVRARKQRADEPEEQSEPKVAELMDVDEVHDSEPQETSEAPAPEEPPRQRRKLLTPSEISAESGSETTGPNDFVLKQPGLLDDLFSVGPAQGNWSATVSSQPGTAAQAAVGQEGVAVLLADEPSPEGGWSPETQWSWQGTQGIRAQEQEGALTVENPLKQQAEDLQKQIAEFRQMAQDVQQMTRERPDPLGNTLKELTQQVSAIREYAASQQDRVEKLQDGYDWGIVRTFCLRVIRCIDNLEGRLDDLPKEDGAVRHLEEVRDELLFALESSSVEQYRPEVNSEFHGQEKLAEALKERQPSKKPNQTGRIARVIRPGYRYMMDDENYRVVRTAQVKLYA